MSAPRIPESRRRAAIPLLLVTWFALAAPVASAADASRATAEATRIVVGYERTDADLVAAHRIATAAAPFGVTLVRVDPALDFAVLGLPEGSASVAIESLAARPDVRYAEPDVVERATFTPDDPNYSAQWGLPAVKAPAAWDTHLGSHAVRVAVIDTGIDASHPDLAPNYCEDGPNYVNEGERPLDDHGHGTSVAGTIAARIDNGIGVAGVANVCLVSIKTLAANGQGFSSDSASAMRWAADNGIEVVNMSLGSDTATSFGRDAAAYAADRGVVLVAAAGNDGCPHTSSVDYPAAYPDVIAVAALAYRSDSRASFSDCGPQVELAAPGESIATTQWGGGYRYVSGTSIASPHVAGVAALVRSEHPGFDGVDVRCILADTADDLGATGRDVSTGHGRVDAAESIVANGCGGFVTRTEIKPYAVGVGLSSVCRPVAVGGNCFEIQPGDVAVELKVDDHVLLTPGARWRFNDADGDNITQGTFCDPTGPIPIPDGAALLWVHVDSIANFSGCITFGGTAGDITAGFKRPA